MKNLQDVLSNGRLWTFALAASRGVAVAGGIFLVTRSVAPQMTVPRLAFVVPGCISAVLYAVRRSEERDYEVRKAG